MAIFDDADFGHLEPVATARYELSQVAIPRTNPKPVVLIVKHAGSSNERYQSALVKLPRASGKDATRQIAGLFAKHVITGWENVLSQDKPLAYSPTGGEELLGKLLDSKRDDIVMGVILFARDADNFRDPVVEPGDLGNG